MARIAGVDIPREKRLEISLTYIYGIGRTTANQVCTATGINPDTRVRDLTDEEVARLRTWIDANLKVEGDLRRDVAQDIKRKIEIGSYQGIRHRRGCRCGVNAPTPTPGPARAQKDRGRQEEGKEALENAQAEAGRATPPSPRAQERRLRGRAHQELVQQHDRLHQRPGGQRPGLGVGRQRRLQGVA